MTTPSSHPASSLALDAKETDMSVPASASGSRPVSIKAAEPEPAPPAFNPGWRFYLAFSSLSIITLMAALDATSLSVALPIMAKALHGSAIQAFWAATSFLLTSTVFQPVVGNFSDVFGRRPLIYISLAFFTAGAIIAGVANNFTVILVGRSIQGIGGGGIIILTEIVVTDMVPLRERGKWFSFISSMWALGTVAGPLLGGGFAQNVTWRWIFWINFPFIAISLLFVTLFLRLNYKVGSFMEKLQRIDWIGTVLFIASMTGFLIPLTWGGVMYPWSHWRTLVPLIVCAAGLVALIVYEESLSRRGFEPVIRTEVLKNRTAAVTMFGTFIHGIVLWAILYYLPLYFEGVHGFSAILTGVALFPLTFTVAPASVATGVAIAISGRYRWSTWVGWFLTVFGLGLMTMLKTHTSTAAWVFLTLVPGIGTGMLFAAMAIAVQASSTDKLMSHAVIMNALFRSLGQTVGSAIGGVIVQNQMKKKLLKYPLLADKADAYSRDASGLVQIIKNMPESLAKSQLKDAYVDALKVLMIVMCALSALAFIASWFTEGHPLDRELVTEQGFQDGKKTTDEEKVKTEG